LRLGALSEAGVRKTLGFTQRRKDAKAKNNKRIMTENEIAKIIVDSAYHVHRKLGPGLLESVYEVILVHELKKRGLEVERQVSVAIVFEGIKFDEGFRADIIVEDKVIVELKSIEKVMPVHKKQLLTYLRLDDKRLGLLINFGSELIRNGISRVVNGL
jgi:GxxExxY protein